MTILCSLSAKGKLTHCSTLNAMMNGALQRQSDCAGVCRWFPESCDAESCHLHTKTLKHQSRFFKVCCTVFCIVTVLWREVGYTMKYCLRAQAIFHRIPRVESQYSSERQSAPTCTDRPDHAGFGVHPACHFQNCPCPRSRTIKNQRAKPPAHVPLPECKTATPRSRVTKTIITPHSSIPLS